MANSCRISATSTLNVPVLARRLNQVEIQIVQQGAEDMVQDIKRAWVGWRYAGVPLTTRGRSRAGWKWQFTSNTQPPEVLIRNDAQDYQRGSTYYVEFIHRSGSPNPEWDIQIRRVQQAHLPGLLQRLTAAVQAAINQPGIPAQIRPQRPGQVVRRTII